MNVRVTVVGTLCLGGCSVLSGIDPDYPKTWPALNPVEANCEQVAGRFENKGTATHAVYGESYHLLFNLDMHQGLKGADFDAVKTVRIRCIGEDALLFEALDNTHVVREKRLSRVKEEWSSEPEGINVLSRWETDTDALGGHTGRRTLILSRAKDGSLIGEERWGAAGLLFWLIPMAGSQTYWHKWPASANP